jgi:serine/threonine-protein kinase
MLGAVAATCGSLLAVSMLGHGIAAPPSQQLTAAMVNRALASEAAESASPLPTPTPSPSVQLGGVAMPITRATPAPSQAPAPATPQPPAGTVLSSAGGTVVALCEQGGSYLQSWSPQQGYEASGVLRGPAGTAQVSFTSNQGKVTMLVTCRGGVPSAAVHTNNWGGGGGGVDE